MKNLDKRYQIVLLVVYLKDAIKDIDVVVRSKYDMNLQKSALEQMGY